MLNHPRYPLLALLLVIPLLGISFVVNLDINDKNKIQNPDPAYALDMEVNQSNISGQDGHPLAVLVPPSTTPNSTGTFTTITTTPSATPTTTITSTPVIRLAVRSEPVLYVFINVPSGPVVEPYVVLSAYRSVPSITPLQITGRINNTEFICPDTPCRLAVTPNVKIIFQAQGPLGETSNQVQATVRIETREDGYYVFLEQVSQYFTYQDACATMWGIDPRKTDLAWAELPQQPEKLATSKTLHYLAGQLIRSGAVNADDCPGYGFDSGGAPNRCGLDRARPVMIEWQNLFDFDIWLTAKDLQIAPRLLKVLIETESQFWPSNQRSYVDEIGLGQINQLGIDVLIRQDPSLYQLICPSVLGNCSIPYSALPESLKAMIRGALLNSLNASCKTCPYGIDISVAKQSITMVALLLRANCRQVGQTMDLYETTASYEDLWKFTLVSYHSGLSCVENAIERLATVGEATDWIHVSGKIACDGSVNYVERLWSSLTNFDTYRLKPEDEPPILGVPTFLPTPTPIPTIGPPPSEAEVWVIVILDETRNGIPEESEWINGITVTLQFQDGTKLSAVTSNGKAIFDMKGRTSGTRVTVNLPALYRTTSFNIPERGILPIVFVFLPPSIPPAIP